LGPNWGLSCYAPAVAAMRRGRGEDGISFEHAKGRQCRDAKYHRHCEGRWRGSVSLGFDADGKRIRRKVSARTKTACQDAIDELREEMGRAPKTSRTYTVNQAVADWLENGLGQSARTRKLYQDALAPVLKAVGHRPLRDLRASEVKAALDQLTGRLSTRSLQLSRNSLERAISFAEVQDRVGRNVAALVKAPTGREGRRKRSFTLAQAAAVIEASRELPEIELHPGLKDPRRPAALMHAYIVLSLMAGVRTEEARAVRWDNADLDGDPDADPPIPPHVDVWRADRAGGDTKTPTSRRGLRLPELAVRALRALLESQAEERRYAGVRWQETGLVFTTATGTPLGARSVRRMFKDICERAAVGGDWAPRDMRHTFVSLLSDDGMAIEKISRLVGHTSSHVTETVYRQQLRPVLQDGAEVMDRIFGHENEAAYRGEAAE
jgi:integrase